MINTGRLWKVCAATLALFLGVLARLCYLQIYCHDQLSQRALRESAPRGIELSRGAILDRSGRILAVSLEGESCFADPHVVRDPGKTAAVLSPILQIPARLLQAKLEQRQRRFTWLARRMDPERRRPLQSLHLAGIFVIPEMRRFYPEDTLAAHLLGVVGQDQQGLSGVEQVANSWLAGRAMPYRLANLSSVNKAASPADSPAEVSPQSIVLTIDQSLQYIVEQELALQMQRSHPKSATVIVEDPQTAEILAMASAPTFDPNQWADGGLSQDSTPDILRNPAVENVMEPGSTFKIVTAAAALDLHLVSPSDEFFCENGAWQVQGRTIHDHEKDGWLTFTDVISHSSNIGTAKVALKLGTANLYHYARAFGFGMPTGCGLPGDAAGILRPPKDWRMGSLPTIAFGQETGVTPLQMVNAYAVVANEGLLLEPRLYKGFVDSGGVYYEWRGMRPVRRVVTAETVARLRRMLREVVLHGTGKEAQVAGLDVAGKTGTAQKIDPVTHQYTEGRYLASFCGFAPVNHARLVVGVFLDEPRGSYWGGTEAAPLFARIVRHAARLLHFEPSSLGPIVLSKALPHS